MYILHNTTLTFKQWRVSFLENILNLVSSPINLTVLFFVSMLIWSFFLTFKKKKHFILGPQKYLPLISYFDPNVLNKLGNSKVFDIVWFLMLYLYLSPGFLKVSLQPCFFRSFQISFPTPLPPPPKI